MKKKKTMPNTSTPTPSSAPVPAKTKLEYSKYAEVKQNRIGSTGYSGTLNGRCAWGSLRRKTNSDRPVHKMKNQNMGAVKSTIDWKPLRANEPITISPVATAPCTINAFTGVDEFVFHLAMNEKKRKSRPSAWLVRAPVKIVALVEVSAASTTSTPMKKTPVSPTVARITSTPTASEAAMPSMPKTLRKAKLISK